MRTVVLVDGEHYPPVTRWGIETAIERGHEVVGAVFVGGIEKIDPAIAARRRCADQGGRPRSHGSARGRDRHLDA